MNETSAERVGHPAACSVTFVVGGRRRVPRISLSQEILEARQVNLQWEAHCDIMPNQRIGLSGEGAKNVFQ